MNLDGRSRPFDNNRHTVDRPYLHHQQEDQNVKSTHHDYSQREHRNHNVLTLPLLEHPSPTNPLLIIPSKRSPFSPPINTTLVENHTLFHQDLTRQNYQTPWSKSTTKRAEQTIDKMAPKQTKINQSHEIYTKRVGIHRKSTSETLTKH